MFYNKPNDYFAILILKLFIAAVDWVDMNVFALCANTQFSVYIEMRAIFGPSNSEVTLKRKNIDFYIDMQMHEQYNNELPEKSTWGPLLCLVVETDLKKYCSVSKLLIACFQSSNLDIYIKYLGIYGQ